MHTNYKNDKILPSLIAFGLLAFTAQTQAASGYAFSDLGTITGPYVSPLASAGANGINNLGQVGGYGPGAGSHDFVPFVWNGNVATQLGSVPNAAWSLVATLNDQGQSVGYASMLDNSTHAVRWDGTTATDLGTPGGSMGIAFDINNSGVIAGGGYSSGESSFVPVVWNGSTMSSLPTLGGFSSWAYAINDGGSIVGESGTADGARHAVRWDGGALTDLGSLGGTDSVATSINNSGQVAGMSFLAGDAVSHGTLWDGTNTVDLAGFDPALASYAAGINDAGVVVGDANISATVKHAVLWDHGSLTDLNLFLPADLAAAGWVASFATAINSDGAIVGYLDNRLLNKGGAFMLTPSAVPVPPAIWLLGSALCGMGVIGRRKGT